MAAGGLLHIALKTRNLKLTEKFYTEVLGLKVAFRVPPDMLFLRTPGSKDLVNFVKSRTKLVRGGGLDHFGFKTTTLGLSRIEKNLKENGVAIAGRRGKHAIYFRDPNGYSIECYCD
jgi:catechol 2,3-dioxygenase-like lactoylglutathione lyase family enzyme